MDKPKYILFDLYNKQFEDLIISICSKILGQGVQHFSTGKDGGRDAKFIGTATCYPSKTEPAKGRFIIQAKHTERPFAKFSDNDFFKGKNSVLNEEIPKIKELYRNGEIDHYLLFSNRKLSANTNEEVTKYLSNQTEVKNIHLIGLEMIERYLSDYPRIAKQANINFLNEPLRIDPTSLAEVVKACHRNRDKMLEGIDSIHDFEYIKLKDKNVINGLSEEYFDLIRSDYMPNFYDIKTFLADPKNETYKLYYHETSDDLNESIIVKRSDFSSFDHVLNYIFQRLIERDGDLNKFKPLTRTFLYYMYCNCDLGRKK